MALIPIRVRTTPSGKCKCGAALNHYLDGVLQKSCTGCSDHKARGVSALAAKRIAPKPLSDDARQLIRQIDDMLMDGYDWAEETLSGIRETVLKTGHATENQYKAIQNIEDARR